jgi:hypothetical protein
MAESQYSADSAHRFVSLPVPHLALRRQPAQPGPDHIAPYVSALGNTPNVANGVATGHSDCGVARRAPDDGDIKTARGDQLPGQVSFAPPEPQTLSLRAPVTLNSTCN